MDNPSAQTEPKSNTKLIVGIIVAIVVIIGGYLLLKNNSNEALTNSGPIKIGFIGALTGDAASYGEMYRNVVQLAVDEINNSGGINGRNIEMIYEDGKCSGSASASAAQKLINVDKVKVIIGGACSSESLGAEPVATQNKVLIISALSSSPALTGKSLYFVRNYPSDATQGKVLADVSYNKENFKKIAFIQEQTDYALGIYKSFNDNFEILGGKVLKEEFNTVSNDFRSVLTKLKSQNPDALFIDTQTSASAERIFKQINELNWKPRILISDAVAGDPAFIKGNKASIEGVLAAEFGIDQNNSKFQHLLDSYKKIYNNDVPYQSYAQCAYDAVYMLSDGIKAVGYNGEKLSNWMRTLKDWQGASGLITIGSDGDRASGHVAKIIKNGKVELYTE